MTFEERCRHEDERAFNAPARCWRRCRCGHLVTAMCIRGAREGFDDHRGFAGPGPEHELMQACSGEYAWGLR